MIERTDEILALNVRDRGDREALAALVRRYQGPVYTYLLHWLKDPHDAEDAAQECFLRMVRGIGGYRSDLPFRPWLYRIALNCARTTMARRTEQTTREHRAAAARPEGVTSMNPADLAARREILRSVEDLPDAQKEVVALHYCQGLSHSEVASVLDLPEGTAATRIHAGLQTLRARLATLGVAVATLTIEQALRSAEAVSAPGSILSTVLREAAPGALSGAGTAAVQGGLVVAKTKMSVMVAVAIACTVGGGVAGYSIRSNRAERELAAMETSAPPRPVAAAPKAPAGPAPAARSHSPATPAAASATPAIPAAAAPTPKEEAASKARKFASFLAKAIKMGDSDSSKVDLDPKEAQEFLALMADPEMQKVLGVNGSGPSVAEELGGDLYLMLLEEFNVRLDDVQKAQFQQLFADQAARKQAVDQSSGTAVDRRIEELRSGEITHEKMIALLTPQQRENAAPLFRSERALGPGIPVVYDSEDRLVPALLDSWSRKLIPLNEGERARVAQAASVHAARLNSLQAELSSQYGADFIDRFAGALGYKTEFFSKPDPTLETQARDAYGRFLELERQNRLDLMAALPERAQAIRNADANVYVLGPKRK